MKNTGPYQQPYNLHYTWSIKRQEINGERLIPYRPGLLCIVYCLKLFECIERKRF